jgi:hypothetical protein
VGTPLPISTNRITACFTVTEADGDGISCVKTRWCGGPCGSIDSCGLTYYPVGCVGLDTGPSAGTCCWGVTWTDEWGATTNSPNYTVAVQ